MKKNKIITIAEGCDNHFGSISLAKKMIVEAKKAGADYIKFQHHIPDEEMLKKVPRSKNFKISLYNFLKKNALKIEDHEILKKFSEKNKIKYLCTPFSLLAAQELNDIGLKIFKIGSGEFLDTPFIEGVLKFKKPVIFSTGMSSIDEIDRMYKFIKKRARNEIAFMNCTSEYPPDNKDLNLGFIIEMSKRYKDFIIGHSDHTNNIYSSIVAVSMGAKIIEKHVYFGNKNYGPDKDVSISFNQLKELIRVINDLKYSFSADKKIYKKEKSILKWARRSIVTTKQIKKGEKLSKENIWSKRPGIGIPSFEINNFFGKIAKRNIKKDKLLSKKDIK